MAPPGATWEASVMTPNDVACPDCITRMTCYVAMLRTEYTLAE